MIDQHTRVLRIPSLQAEIEEEVLRALSKYPPFNSPHEGYAVLLEEVDELWTEIKANARQRTREEALQVAAMALRFLVDHDCHYTKDLIP